MYTGMLTVKCSKRCVVGEHKHVCVAQHMIFMLLLLLLQLHVIFFVSAAAVVRPGLDTKKQHKPEALLCIGP